MQEIVNLNSCIHAYNESLREALGRNFLMHNNLYCGTIKKAFHKACMDCDVKLVHEELNRRNRQFLKHCFAGFVEIVTPISFENTLYGVLFTGPFQQTEGQPDCDLIVPLKANLPRTRSLPVAKNVQSLRVTTRIFADWLGHQLYLLRDSSKNDQSYGAKIARFVRTHYHRDIKIADVAQALFLSRSRVSQLMGEELNCTFPELLESTRLENAKILLTTTFFRVTEVAHRVGFKNQSYFHRVFKRSEKMTPRQFRSQNRETLLDV